MNQTSNNGSGNHQTDSNPYKTSQIAEDPGENLGKNPKPSNRRRWYAVLLIYVCALLTMAGVIVLLWWSTGNNFGYYPNPPLWASSIAWLMDFVRVLAATIGFVLTIDILARGTMWQRLWVLLPGYYLAHITWWHVEFLIIKLRKMI